MFVKCNLNLISKPISKPIHQEASYNLAKFLTSVLFSHHRRERISGGSSQFFVKLGLRLI